VTPGGGVQQFLFYRPTPLTSHETQKPPRYLTLLYRPDAGHILFLRILYPIHIHAQKKDMDIYPISFVKNFASIVTVSEQPKARPGSTAARKYLTFYRIELTP
jgi:hypothetical protein